MTKRFSIGQPVVYIGDRNLEFAGRIMQMSRPGKDGHYTCWVKERSGHIRRDPDYLLRPMPILSNPLMLVKNDVTTLLDYATAPTEVKHAKSKK